MKEMKIDTDLSTSINADDSVNLSELKTLRASDLRETIYS